MEETSDDGNTGKIKREATSIEIPIREEPKKLPWYHRLLRPAEKPLEPHIEKLPEGTPLPDIITKMLVDSGCTVNRDGVEKLADYFISTLIQAIEDQEVNLNKARRIIEQERQRYKP